MKVIFGILASLLPLIASQELPCQGLVKAELRSCLRAHYFDGKHDPLSYQDARLAMYNQLDVHNGVLTGVYGGFEQQPPNGGYTVAGQALPINAEHTVPQSRFSKLAVPRADIHHLFPTHQTPNNARGNFPFANVSVADTRRWYIGPSYQSTTPAETDQPMFSRLGNQQWQPRAQQLGDTARAVGYFFCMYESLMDGFGVDISSVMDPGLMVSWHKMDPPTDHEKQRDTGIQTFQGNINPFVSGPLWLLQDAFVSETPSVNSTSSTVNNTAPGVNNTAPGVNSTAPPLQPNEQNRIRGSPTVWAALAVLAALCCLCGACWSWRRHKRLAYGRVR